MQDGLRNMRDLVLRFFFSFFTGGLNNQTGCFFYYFFRATQTKQFLRCSIYDLMPDPKYLHYPIQFSYVVVFCSSIGDEKYVAFAPAVNAVKLFSLSLILELNMLECSIFQQSPILASKERAYQNFSNLPFVPALLAFKISLKCTSELWLGNLEIFYDHH